jgi:hypothetical protein
MIGYVKLRLLSLPGCDDIKRENLATSAGRYDAIPELIE